MAGPTPVRTRPRPAVPFVLGIAVALIAVALFATISRGPAPITQRDVKNAIASALASQTPPPALSVGAYAAARPSLVLIEAQTASGTNKPARDLGSGVVVTEGGDILTALHVVSDAQSIEVTFADGTKSSARVTGSQIENDIAVLRAANPPAQLLPAVLGNPNSLAVGSDVYAVGNPFALTGSLSAGVVSGLDRTFQRPNSDRVLHGLIQFDAAVNPGNSGGPLLNRNGEVVGIVLALVNPTDQDVFIGIGLAVPITTAGAAAGLPPY